MTTMRIIALKEYTLPYQKDETSKARIIPHSNVHKYSWTFSDGKIDNQDAHILTDKRHSSILHVQSFGGTYCDTDQYLAVAKVREILSASTGGTYKFLMQRFFLMKLNSVEEKKNGSKFPTDVQL
jgi:hypothetical protein